MALTGWDWNSPLLTDNFGRKLPIAIGCVIMIAGAVVQGACQNLNSMISPIF